MKESEDAIYEQAFNELEKEGYFKKLSAKIKRLRFSVRTESNSFSKRQRHTHKRIERIKNRTIRERRRRIRNKETHLLTDE